MIAAKCEMDAYILDGGFGLQNLRRTKLPLPSPGPGDVLVRIDAVSLNYRDLLVIDGKRPVPLPFTPLSDAAGRVAALGDGVSEWAEGDRVMPAFAPFWQLGPLPPENSLPTWGAPLPGVLAEYCVFPASALVAVPEHLSMAEAAVLPCAWVSAWNALFVAGSIGPGSVVLIEGSGGVSLAALQLARSAGARVIATTSRDENFKRLKDMGAEAVVSYRTREDWGQAVREFAPEGVDLVVEVGGSTSMAQAFEALRNGGTVSYVGFLSGTEPRFDLGEISRKALKIFGIRVGNVESFHSLSRAMGATGLHPVIGPSFSFAEAPSAIAAYRDEHPFGKVTILIPETAA